ncbi:hypothetical protein [Pseudoalteromonas ruthenica]|uniref:hypothetical protein n=1 Tax=Pseudoalteromonas ruthenica TaxID=151081 RepID=UPI0003B6E898|nr:hypothetical protein [Pseudoalteromonas ruthenica]
MNRCKSQECGKEVAYYSATVSAWFNTKFEMDKQLLSLSSAGVGLLITLMTAFGVVNLRVACFFALSLLCYIITVISVLLILYRNGKFLEKLNSDKNKNKNENDNLLLVLDFTARTSFVIGILLTSAIGIETSLNKLEIQESFVIDKSKLEKQPQENKRKSLNGAGRMRPNDTPNKQPGETSPKNTNNEGN